MVLSPLKKLTESRTTILQNKIKPYFEETDEIYLFKGKVL